MNASQLLDQLLPLNVDQIWCIVENLLVSQLGLKEMNVKGELEDPEPLKVTEETLLEQSLFIFRSRGLSSGFEVLI